MKIFKKGERPGTKSNLSFIARMVHLKPLLPASTDVLEIGCGKGFMAEYLIENNCQVTGIDYNQEAIFEASRLPGEFLCVDLYKYKPKKRFNFIICSEVLEHLGDDEKALKLMYSWLKPEGKLLLTVPTYMPLTSRLKKYAGHQRHYQPDKLKSLVSKAGFKIEKEKQWGCLTRRLILGYLPTPFYQIPVGFWSITGRIFGPLVKLESKIWPFPDSLLFLVSKQKVSKPK